MSYPHLLHSSDMILRRYARYQKAMKYSVRRIMRIDYLNGYMILQTVSEYGSNSEAAYFNMRAEVVK